MDDKNGQGYRDVGDVFIVPSVRSQTGRVALRFNFVDDGPDQLVMLCIFAAALEQRGFDVTLELGIRCCEQVEPACDSASESVPPDALSFFTTARVVPLDERSVAAFSAQHSVLTERFPVLLSMFGDLLQNSGSTNAAEIAERYHSARQRSGGALNGRPDCRDSADHRAETLISWIAAEISDRLLEE
jgi:hypothetical protein